jgi:hypothetical protein
MNQKNFNYKPKTPARRPLKIYASDPLLDKAIGNRITIDIPNEELSPGPRGERIAVIDYDAVHKRYYKQVNLDDPALLMQSGIDPTESDPCFHQQMVYAVSMKTLENFDNALGRKTSLLRKKEPLKIFPHGFYGPNAFYDPGLHALFFGYFRADKDEPGPNLPMQNVFTCLSHDIITHEFTHAIINKLRPYYNEPANYDSLAFHEGFSDIVALFQHFSFKELLKDAIEISKADLRSSSWLVGLARQFGYATGMKKSLRSALDKEDIILSDSITECHERGSIFVSAVFEAFYTFFRNRIKNIIKLATAGSGILPEGDMQPGLVSMITEEAGKAAQHTLNMCIRAFDYLPVAGFTMGDFLRALITADSEMFPVDKYGYRRALIDAFRKRKIYPENIYSLSEDSIILKDMSNDIPPIPKDIMNTVNNLHLYTLLLRQSSKKLDEYLEQENLSSIYSIKTGTGKTKLGEEIAVNLHKYAIENCQSLGLSPDPKEPISLKFHTAFRNVAGVLWVDLIIQYMQTEYSDKEIPDKFPFRGGTTVIASADGTIRHLVMKPIRTVDQEILNNEANIRFQHQEEYTNYIAMRDVESNYLGNNAIINSIKNNKAFAGLYSGGVL